MKDENLFYRLCFYFTTYSTLFVSFTLAKSTHINISHILIVVYKYVLYTTKLINSSQNYNY
jgi:hypothetical protein